MTAQLNKKQAAPGEGPEAEARAGTLQTSRQNYYTPILNKSHTLTTKEKIALWWLKRDFLLLPVQPNSKKLVPGFGMYQDKITTQERVGQWFGERSLANLAVCGTQTSFILDFDDADLYKFWVSKFPNESRTYTEQTPRGGYHVFAHTWGRDLKRIELIKGVELKRVVVVSPSVIDNKPYTRGPGELLDLDAPLVLFPLSQIPIVEPSPRVDVHAKGYLQKIKSAFSCLALIQSVKPDVKISRSPRRFISVSCPFHDDKEPSFWIDTDRNLWGCHACGVRGDVINLYARLKNITNQEAIFEMGKSL